MDRDIVLKFVLDELQRISKDSVRTQNRLFALKMFVDKVLEKGYVSDYEMLEFDDPILEDVPHG